jgi:hypothetical protein
MPDLSQIIFNKIQQKYLLFRSVSEGACEGAGSQMQTCWSGSTCADTRDVRGDLCSRQDRLFIPYMHPNGKFKNAEFVNLQNTKMKINKNNSRRYHEY